MLVLLILVGVFGIGFLGLCEFMWDGGCLGWICVVVAFLVLSRGFLLGGYFALVVGLGGL